MRHIIFAVIALGLSIGVFSCRPKQATAPQAPATETAPAPESQPQGSTQDKYIAAMSEVGCSNIIDETSSQAQSIYQKHGISYDDIKQFRMSSDVATMQTIAGEIAKRVAACH
ncbi:MAG: hypothetical protein A3F82_10955 [Deltaproteobacteria bacterium RIFCSPLOWO2_12_FULL_44_12]|nr:MAG: hypothetical protein A2712_08960 [Deltaproteobacteria bacterium RIFCSPHIGHO2_01_FULL_43_49]OGQ14535.1 MAG: hypothetical protein A3D22_08040 [Deltaproteobacteria bacterium RIFCSPHIGHO2_02_FULL_44_53]OGQ27921.1 MAG: hypothetical protein A3D98_06750 [Deltaproteobacteria bacterium RIFCSPHIGHO2_12_FULL_44_21]OGQ31133.1 MAG: hypothetical protein A2979_06800 [Deltaproteobacteria bacterium RIFCSPLOWO2_01_FULL_45_74]OGQ43124.1 MAG: hypothetical protein A3I70_00455 [Deltaproteobacteria bacterium 